MTYWLTISFIVNLAIFVVQTDADFERLNSGPDKQTDLLAESDLADPNIDRLNKRADFMHSRGKKEQQTDNLDGTNKRAGFMPMRGRKDFYDQPQQGQDWFVGGPQYQQYQDDMDNDKRAGFMPMRGRKNDAFNDVYPLELNNMKRMASFMPSRGRKDDFAYNQMNGQPSYGVPLPYSQNIQNMDKTNWMEGQHSLTGSRSDDVRPELEKKASAFFGSRGKRSVPTEQGSGPSDGQGAIQEDHHKYTENFFATRG